MKTLTILEGEDLEKLKQLFDYFFEQEKGFYQNINTSRFPSKSMRDEELIEIQKAFENSDTEVLADLKLHLCSRLENYREEIKKAEKSIEHYTSRIIKMKETLQLVASEKTLNFAILSVLKNNS